ncbi:MAG: NPCBM/NEW2 domain-containing protein [Armatimonadota bacterium]
MRLAVPILCGIVIMGTGTGNTLPESESQHISNIRDIIWESTQGWGMLGYDTAAHLLGQEPMPLKIKDTVYEKGLGSHAPGEIIIELDNRYKTFEAEVGVQPFSKEYGSVVFQVYVDDVLKFDSGVMKTGEAAKPVSVPVSGASELRLVVTDAGDGINCDLGNWANARLISSGTAASKLPRQAVDMGSFARVVTSDPERTDGIRSSRVQEIDPSDLFMETDLSRSAEGYTVPAGKNGMGTIGLQWIERRRLKQLGIQFSNGSGIPASDKTQVQYWSGLTRWQGEWKPLDGVLKADGSKWTFDIDWKENPDAAKGTLKIRWIIPQSDKPITVDKLLAFTNSRLGTGEIILQSDKSSSQPIEISMYNGEISGTDGSAYTYKNTLSPDKPLKLTVRYSKPSAWKSDRTMLRVKLPEHEFAIAVDDLLANDCIYIKKAGLLAYRQSSPVSPEEYKMKIAGSKTILEQTRSMPDQTLEQAIAHVYDPAQDNPPTMLSLACDNNKFVIHRGTEMLTSHNELKRIKYAEGAIRRAVPTSKEVWFEPFEFRPTFGSGENLKIERSIQDGWLPVTITSLEENGITYTQRTFAAPYDEKKQRSLCISEFTISNTQSKPANASLKFAFLADAEQNLHAELQKAPGSIYAMNGEQLQASVDTSDIGKLDLSINGGEITLSGEIPVKGKKQFVVYIPSWQIKPKEYKALKNPEKYLSATRRYWRGMLSDSMRVEIPDKYLQNIIMASQVHCMIATRTGEDGSIQPWVSSMWYGPLESESNSVIRGMQLMGHDDYAKKSLEYFISLYNPEGFLTTGYTLMGTGWHLKTLGEYYSLTRNRNWMKSIAPKVANVSQWIARQEEKTKRLDIDGSKIPEYGLMPPGVMADWEPFAYYYCLNGYYYSGLKGAASALADIGYKDADKMLQSAGDLKENIERSYQWTRSASPVIPLKNGTWVPAYASQVYTFGPTANFYPGEGWAWCYDVELGGHHLITQGVLDPLSPSAREMMDHMEDVQFFAEGVWKYRTPEQKDDWFNIGGFSKVQPYYTRNVEIYAMQDEVKPFIRSYFNTLPSLLCKADLSLWEHPHGLGAWNKTHETGYFLQQTRFMFVMEHGDELWLAPFVTDNWMKDGMDISINRAPTAFGRVTYKIDSHAAEGYIEATIDPPTRKSPKEIVVRLRHPDGKKIRSVTVNGEPHTDFDASKDIVRIKPSDTPMKIRANY